MFHQVSALNNGAVACERVASGVRLLLKLSTMYRSLVVGRFGAYDYHSNSAPNLCALDLRFDIDKPLSGYIFVKYIRRKYDEGDLVLYLEKKCH